MNEKRGIAVINTLGFLFLLASSFIFAMNGNMFNTQEIMPIFMPAPYAFSIWFLIYACLGVWVGKGFFASADQMEMYQDIGYWFFVCMILTGLTILVPINISPIFIISALITALVIYKKIDSNEEISKLFRVPFSLLTGWLSVATIVNISLVLKMNGVTELLGIGEMAWAIILLAVGTVIAILFTIKNEDNLYPLVFIWGYIAIAVQNQDNDIITKMVIAMCIIILVAIGYNILGQIGEKSRL